MSIDHFWSHSWLSYGVVKVRERLWDQLVAKHGSEETPLVVLNPCTQTGHEEEYGEGIILRGSGFEYSSSY